MNIGGENNVKYIKVQRLRWFGHTERREEAENIQRNIKLESIS